MKRNFYLSKLIFIMVLILGLVGCNSKKEVPASEKKEITVAVTEISEVSLKAAESEFQKRGFTEKLILVDSNIAVLKSVNDGSVDAAMAVHKPFMEKFNKENNGDLVMVQPYTYYTGIGLYSEKYKSLEELPQKARISIMNDAMNMDKTLLATMEDESPAEMRTKLRSILGSLMFSGEDVDKKVSVLSGGERGRLALALLLLHPINFLVLDEPTNHLDPEAKEELKRALVEYKGTILLVSHEPEFYRDIVEEVWNVEDWTTKVVL